VLLAAASPAFTVTAISYYSMGAHLCASLAYAALLVSPTPRRLLAAGAVGSLALALHNPLPHALFALPFIVLVAARPARFRNLALLAAGYLPGVLVLVLGWMWVRCDLMACAGTGSAMDLVQDLFQSSFRMPGRDVLWARIAGLLKLALWGAPGLLPLAWWGARARRGQAWWRALMAATALTLIAYLFVAYDQGHGWGYRYFHSAWGALPLLGAAALTTPGHGRETLRRVVFLACFASSLALTALRFVQVRTFIDAHLGQIPASQRTARLEVVFVRIGAGYYSVDLVQNDPFLRGARWILISRGRAEDEQFVRRMFPSARLGAQNDVASVWQID
jgi:hypothetical protein